MMQHDTYDTFLVILKVHGDAIHLRPYEEKRQFSKLKSYRIFCHNLDANQSGSPGSSVKVFVLPEHSTSPGTATINGNHEPSPVFQRQAHMGEPISATDMTIFMSSPFDASKKASFAIDLGVSMHTTSLEDLNEDQCRKLGTAYIYLDPKFSTRGIQRMQIIGAQSFASIGHMQIEYLIVKNPHAYGVDVPLPKWLSRNTQIDAGHRGSGSGCRADLPGSITENTIASFNYAAQHGANMCELDVMCTADGIPVVYHNFILHTDKPDRNQIEQLTLDELRSLGGEVRMHDPNCTRSCLKSSATALANSTMSTSTTPTTASATTFGNKVLASLQNNKLFPTLEEVLKEVDSNCALNIELKCPQLLTNGKCEANFFREINDFVDRVLNCIHDYGGERPIVLSTFNPDVAIMLRLKQTLFPVLFLTTGDSQRFFDPITKTIKNAVHFAKAFDLAGVNPNVDRLTEYLVRYAKDRGLLVFAWGKIESPQAVKELRRFGLNGVIYDKVDLIKPHD